MLKRLNSCLDTSEPMFDTGLSYIKTITLTVVVIYILNYYFHDG